LNNIAEIDVCEKEDQKVILGDSTSEEAISFQLAQAFYNEITGKSERLSDEFSTSFVLTMSNVEQLHHRVIQSTVQYNIASANASFSVSYVNDSSERFSSIERFTAHAGAKGVAIDEIDLNYNLLVILPKTNKPQEYRINIKLVSRTAKIENIKSDIAELPVSIPLAQFESKFTCRVSIDFVDVTVANSFMSVIKSWNDCLETTDFNEFIRVIRRFSDWFPVMCQYGLLLMGSYFTYSAIESFFKIPTPESTAIFLLFAALFNFLLFKVGLFIGRRSERHLDQTYQMSYINFSGADAKLAKDSIKSVKGSVIKSFAYVIGSVILGVMSSGIASYIFKS
jgi:hypothetical protein